MHYSMLITLCQCSKQFVQGSHVIMFISIILLWFLHLPTLSLSCLLLLPNFLSYSIFYVSFISCIITLENKTVVKNTLLNEDNGRTGEGRKIEKKMKEMCME